MLAYSFLLKITNAIKISSVFLEERRADKVILTEA
jgi:hypothetical protein